jgi:glycosyltransferase involved in cell wall biosynthesis
MNQPTKLELIGIFRPRDKGPGFGIPVFAAEDCYWVQRVGDDGRVMGFTVCDVEPDSLKPPPVEALRTGEVGQAALYAFEEANGTISVATREDLGARLRGNLSNLRSTAFVFADVADFLGDVNLKVESAALCEEILSKTRKTQQIVQQLSVVIPVYNEEENVEPIIREVNRVLVRLDKTFEIVVVDDGSADGTFWVLSRLHGLEPRLKIVRLKRNFGQTAAIAAGLAYAQGEIVVLMDGDGQTDPADIPELLQKLQEGNDLVVGWRVEHTEPLVSRCLLSTVINRLTSWKTKVKLRDYGCPLKAMRRDVAKNLRLYGDTHRLIPAIAHERGAQIAELQVNHRPRLHGKSKYGITRTLQVILDLFTQKFLPTQVMLPLFSFIELARLNHSYLNGPSLLFRLIGVLSYLIGVVLVLYASLHKFIYNVDIGGWSLFLLSVLFVIMGLLGGMLARTHSRYVVREVLL